MSPGALTVAWVGKPGPITRSWIERQRRGIPVWTSIRTGTWFREVCGTVIVNHRRPLIFRGCGPRPSTIAEKEAFRMGDKKRHIEEIVVETESHRVRSMMILLIVAAVTFGLWYLVSDRG